VSEAAKCTCWGIHDGHKGFFVVAAGVLNVQHGAEHCQRPGMLKMQNHPDYSDDIVRQDVLCLACAEWFS
jgi:hypothetical protein